MRRPAGGSALREWLEAEPWPEPVARIEAVPILCNALYEDRLAACAAPLGDVELLYSPVSGLLWNRCFDPARAAYDPRYENSLHHSPGFAAHARSLAERLIEGYGLRDRRVVEIGPGEGNFLALLCELGPNDGIGYDAAYDPGRSKVTTSARMTIVPEYYPYDRPVDAELVVCQHVLEHLPDPAALVEGVRRSIPPGAPTAVYVEVPDATYMVERRAIWDVIYEHHTYFTASTLAGLFRGAGFEVLDVGRSFGDQYLYLEARAAPGHTIGEVAEPPAAAGPEGEFSAQVREFGDAVTAAVARWRAELAERSALGPLAVWGAGSKGAMFLNLVDPERRASWVIDVNPNKAGLYVPGSGHRIDGPEVLRGSGVRTVVVLNPRYVEEIRGQLGSLGVDADVIAVTD